MFVNPLMQRLRSSIKPAVLSSFGLFTSGALTTTRHSSTAASVKKYLVREPSPSAPREVPTPLVFLSASSWDTSARTDWVAWSGMLVQQGFTCIEIDLAPPEVPLQNGEELMETFVDQLSQQIRLSMNPFPPVLLAHSAGASLIAQSYISSHPCSALFLLDPPASITDPSIPPNLLPGGGLKEFDYEPRFPIGVMVLGEEGEKKFEGSRLGREGTGRVECLRVDGTGKGSVWEGNEGRVALERWMDRAGI
ncbi:hypothetical protein BDY24DRAFT_440807 [Mrakia frigida]|uniref:uncharacterized protein n=1 Tax=Mrakia frigida TaxID=29902 RepID=UPI003FCC18AB